MWMSYVFKALADWKYDSVTSYFLMKRGSVVLPEMLSDRDGLRPASSHPDFHKGLREKSQSTVQLEYELRVCMLRGAWCQKLP